MSNLTINRGEKRVLQTTVNNLGSNGLNDYPHIIFSATPDLATAPPIQKKLGVSADISVTTVGNATTAGVISTILRFADTGSLPNYQLSYTWDVQLSDGSSTTEPIVVDSGTLTITPHATLTNV